jgi:hypothetical protein
MEMMLMLGGLMAMMVTSLVLQRVSYKKAEAVVKK